MLYKDYRIGGSPYRKNSDLDRTELYEMLHFIKHIGKAWTWSGNPIASYQ